MVLVSVLSALLLALASSFAARVLWEGRERRELAAAAESLAAAIEREAKEDQAPPVEASREALRESTLPGYRVEVWSGHERVASAPPRPAELPDPASDASLRHTRLLPSGLTLVVSEPPEASARALRLFFVSLAAAAPACLLAAIVVSSVVARRATRPLRDLQQRIGALVGLEPLPPSDERDVPLEIADLETAFRSLWGRVAALLQREAEFAANASHELRTPLTRLRLHAERALVDAGPIAQSALRSQMDELDRLARLVDALLVMARDVSAGTPGETLNLADVCRRVAHRTLDGAAWRADGLPDEALVRGDEALVEIAVENLLDNARKFSSGAEAIRLDLAEADGVFQLAVTTPGGRIARGSRERLFGRFHRDPAVRSRTPGHGLGLALARHIALLHGGDVRCVSADGQDARFVLALPPWTTSPPAPETPHDRS
jgi:two-component system sensor histidine kinase MtrB